MATVQSYTKAGVDQKIADRSYRVLPHPGGGTPNLASYPDAKTGDIIERNSDGARWNVLAGTLNPDTGRVVSVAGKTGIVTLGPTDVGAAPTSHTHTKAQITDLNASTSATANSIAQRTTGGRLVVGTPTSTTDATTKAYVDQQVAIPQAWSVITGKPSVYPPDSHTHTKAQITDLNASTTATANSIAQRTTNGRLVVGTPTSSTDAATKAYVDTAATNASKWASITGKPVTVSDTISTANAGAYLVLNSGGRISAGTPTQDSDVANKAYVDSKTWTIDNIADITVSTSATANTVAQRTTGGRLLVGTPSGTTDATTKAYVDSAVTASKAWANLTGKPSTFPPSTHTHTVSQITDFPASTSEATANQLVVRDANGRAQFANPYVDADAATKSYVDTTVAGKTWANLSGKPSTFTPSSHTHTKAQISDLNASATATANSIAQRTSDGRLVVSTPTEATDAATKAYVDSSVPASMAWSSLTGKPSTFTPSAHTHTIANITDLTVSTSATADTVAKRIASGRLTVGTPTATTDATTKAYVDAEITSAKAWGNLTGVPSTFTPATHTHTIAQITDLTVSTAATANTVAKRTTGGRLVVGTPSATSEATTKAYVDSAVTASKAWANLTGKPSTYPPSTHTHTKSQITDLPTIGIGITGSAVVQRDTDGQIFVHNVPSNNQHAASKNYVDRTLDAKFESTLLTTEDLNNVAAPGSYAQHVDSNATTARNYPNNRKSGHLVVTGSGDDFVLQEYTEHDSKAKYYRTKYGTAWYPWVRIAEEPWTGTQAQYNAITTKDPNRLYIIIS